MIILEFDDNGTYRFAKRLKMAGYNSEERAQPAVCVRLSNLILIEPSPQSLAFS